MAVRAAARAWGAPQGWGGLLSVLAGLAFYAIMLRLLDRGLVESLRAGIVAGFRREPAAVDGLARRPGCLPRLAALTNERV